MAVREDAAILFLHNVEGRPGSNHHECGVDHVSGLKLSLTESRYPGNQKLIPTLAKKKGQCCLPNTYYNWNLFSKVQVSTALLLFAKTLAGASR